MIQQQSLLSAGIARTARRGWCGTGFQPSPNEPLDFASTVEATVFGLRQRFNLRAVRFDPYQMVSTAQRLRAAGIRIEEFPQSVPNLTEASQNLYELIKGRNLIFYPDADIRRAMNQAVALEGTREMRLRVQKPS
jgi:phage terminase large subunit-like protein